MIYGIICEFNPFHQGHRHLIKRIKKEGDSIICAMSGNFVQRGEPAVYDKFTRASAALDGGADLVLEIPTPCCLLSAQGYAQAGVGILEATGVCEALAFGAECADLEALQALSDEIQRRADDIKAEMDTGITYAKARQNVLRSPLLEGANNILALEYLAATSLQPIAVQRIGMGHDSQDAHYSASAIRKSLRMDEIAALQHCERAVLYKLRTMSAADFAMIEDVNEGLEHRIVQAVKQAASLEELYSTVKTKRYTHARIRRIILRAYLDIYGKTKPQAVSLRVLGFNQNGRQLLHAMKTASKLPLITSYADAKAHGGNALQAFEQECRYTNIYNTAYAVPRPCGTEQTTPIIIKKELK